MKFFKNDIIFIGSIIVIVSLAFFSEGYEEQKKKRDKIINQNLFETVARVENVRRRSYDYTFYFNKRKYYVNEENIKSEASKSKGKFYIVELSSKNPNYSRLLFDEEVKDSAIISNAGFRKKTLTELLEYN